MTLLVVVWALTGMGYFWPIWPIVGWGLGIVSTPTRCVAARRAPPDRTPLACPAVPGRAIAPVLAALALLLAGCGGGGQKTTQTAAKPRATPRPRPRRRRRSASATRPRAFFAAPLFRQLGIDKARRRAVGHDAGRRPDQLADQWLTAAKQAGVEPFVSFSASRVHRRSCRRSRSSRRPSRRSASAGRRSAPTPRGRDHHSSPSRPPKRSRARGRLATTWCATTASGLHGRRRRRPRPGRDPRTTQALPRRGQGQDARALGAAQLLGHQPLPHDGTE